MITGRNTLHSPSKMFTEACSRIAEQFTTWMVTASFLLKQSWTQGEQSVRERKTNFFSEKKIFSFLCISRLTVFLSLVGLKHSEKKEGKNEISRRDYIAVLGEGISYTSVYELDIKDGSPTHLKRNFRSNFSHE